LVIPNFSRSARSGAALAPAGSRTKTTAMAPLAAALSSSGRTETR
jgi:hypothetical protein